MDRPNLKEWLLENIRQDNKKWVLERSWLEENRYLWIDTAVNTIKRVTNGEALLIATDNKREWFEHYTLYRFYAQDVYRPILPIFSLNSIIPENFVIQKDNFIDIYNMLSVAYQEYTFWYIGQTDSIKAELCIGHDAGLFWIMGEGIKNAFSLKNNDELLDYKLIEMLRLFEKCLYAAVFNQIKLD